jgi:hypothetical protein
LTRIDILLIFKYHKKIRDMKGLELLEIGEVYTIQTAYATYPNLKFMGFFTENDDVTLAAFSSTELFKPSCHFDITVISNQVLINQ